MYLFFDRDGTLKEQITISPPRFGDENVNTIYVYWDNDFAVTIPKNRAYCRYKKPNGEYTLNLTADDVVNETIPYDQNRDLKFFKYNQSYRFFAFNIPSDIFASLENVDVYSVLFSCWFIYIPTRQKTMGLVAFAVEPSTQSVALDQNINIAQWNELIYMITTTTDFDNISVQEITFKESNTPSNTGLSMKNNVIYWRGSALVTASDLANYVTTNTDQTITGQKRFVGDITIEEGTLDIENDAQIPLVDATVRDDEVSAIVEYKIVASANEADDNQTFTIELPTDSGTLALLSKVVKLTGNQNINGYKTFEDTVGISVTHANQELFYLSYTQNNKTYSWNVYGPDPTDDEAFDLALPEKSGTLAVKSEVVLLTGDQNVNGKKTMSHLNVGVDTLPASNGMLAFNNNKYYGRVNDTNKEILTQDALTPTALTSATSTALDIEAGGTATVEIIGGIGTYTVSVVSGYKIVASVDPQDGSISSINQTTGVITITSNESFIELAWHYEGQFGFEFNIGLDYNGLYIFEYESIITTIPIYDLVNNRIYNFLGLGSSSNDKNIMVYNMQKVDQTLKIWSRDSANPIDENKVGTLKKVKLY